MPHDKLNGRFVDMIVFATVGEMGQPAEGLVNGGHFKCRKIIHIFMACGKFVSFASEYRMLSRDGAVVWFRDEAAIVCEPSGKPLHLVIYSTTPSVFSRGPSSAWLLRALLGQLGPLTKEWLYHQILFFFHQARLLFSYPRYFHNLYRIND